MAATAVFMPLVYAPFGFLFGVITAAIYNLVARFTGGLELQFADDAPPGPGPS
jgi:amino acid permease